MPVPSSPPPTPWESLGYRNFHLARLFDAVFRRRRLLAAWYPWVPVPMSRVGSPYHRGTGYPAGALVRLWGGWDYLRGRCPACSGPVLGYAFGGALSSGAVTGVCRRCATMVTRFVWGIGTVMRCIRPVLEGTPFGLTGGAADTPDRSPAALIAVLQELGETGLPAPTARGFRPRTPRQRGDVGSPARQRPRRKDSDTL
jgi:hypothetical protein